MKQIEEIEKEEKENIINENKVELENNEDSLENSENEIKKELNKHEEKDKKNKKGKRFKQKEKKLKKVKDKKEDKEDENNIEDENDAEVYEQNKENDESNNNETQQNYNKENKDDEKEQNDKQDNQANKTEQKREKNIGLKAFLISTIAILLSAILGFAIYFTYFLIAFSIKKEVTIEIGKSQLELSDFYNFKVPDGQTEFVTDISQIDLNKVGNHEIEIISQGKNKKVKLNLVDTTAPTVIFKDIERYSGYILDANDFIEEKSDLSEMIVEAVNVPEINDFADYVVTIIVKDEYGNETKKDCKLSIILLRNEYDLELGDKLTKDKILYNAKLDGKYLPQSEIDAINKSSVGEYDITITVNEREFKCHINKKDTMPPDLVLKDITIYDDEKVSGKESFIVSCEDNSGEDVKTTLKTEIKFGIVGTQEIVIIAEDMYGNISEKTAILTIKKDTDGPVFSGLTALTVSKNGSVNYEKGVKAVDAKDGNCSYAVDSSKVNLAQTGTYYATYTAKDTKGNTTTAKRKITVGHDKADTEAKFNDFYNKYLAGKGVYDIVSTVRNKLGYNHEWGGDDPVWYGLNNLTGNCYVHALLVQKALDKAGVTNQIIHTKDKTHYWNLVYTGGVWRHYDSTPGSHIIGPATDSQKFASSAMHGRDWDRTAYPTAE